MPTGTDTTAMSCRMSSMRPAGAGGQVSGAHLGRQWRGRRRERAQAAPFAVVDQERLRGGALGLERGSAQPWTTWRPRPRPAAALTPEVVGQQ